MFFAGLQCLFCSKLKLKSIHSTMNRNNFLKTCIYVFFVTVIFSCTKGGSVSYIPYLSASFKNKAYSGNDAYFFKVAEDGAYSSSFTGEEVLDYATTYTFSGSFYER
ncbi:MAG TPA: hypothetical protein DCO83_09745 [Mucilaginibacter sp.]|nr:hypothetical protein [Mucilaginibacter sp.]